MKAWTERSLEMALRKALPHATLSVGAVSNKDAAQVEWAEDGTNAKIRVDAHEVAIRSGIIHELLHVVLFSEIDRFDAHLGEELVLALEKYLDRRIAVSRRRSLWWRKALNKKLKK